MLAKRDATGWIKLHRKYLKNPIWENDPDNRVFLWLLMTAAHKPKTERVGSRDIFLLRGQVMTSQGEVAAGTGMTRKAVRMALRRLEREGTIRREYPAGPKNLTLVTIAKYAFYQGEEWDGGGRISSGAVQGPSLGPRSGPRKKAKTGQDENTPNIFNYQSLKDRGGLAGAKPEPEKGPRLGPRNGPSYYKEEEGKEDKETPPNPPRTAGGSAPADSLSSTERVLRMWREVREAAGQAYAEDRRTRRGAELLAGHWLDGNAVTAEELRGAMRNLAQEIANNPKARLFDLRTLDGGLSKYLNSSGDGKRAGKHAMWFWTCDTCGETAAGSRPESAGTPAPTPCSQAKYGCAGTMRPAPA